MNIENQKNEEKKSVVLPDLVKEKVTQGWKVLQKGESSITLKKGDERCLFDVSSGKFIRNWSVSDNISFQGSLFSENSGCC